MKTRVLPLPNGLTRVVSYQGATHTSLSKLPSCCRCCDPRSRIERVPEGRSWDIPFPRSLVLASRSNGSNVHVVCCKCSEAINLGSEWGMREIMAARITSYTILCSAALDVRSAFLSYGSIGTGRFTR